MYIYTYVHKYITEHFRGHKFSPKGRTDVKIGRSRIETCIEFHGNLRCSVALQNPIKTHKKLIFKSKQMQLFFRIKIRVEIFSRT